MRLSGIKNRFSTDLSDRDISYLHIEHKTLGSLTIIIDSTSLPDLTPHKWTVFQPSRSKTPYAIMREAPSTLMHRFLKLPPAGREIDHLNGNGLDNRLKNLRICTHKDNMRNGLRNDGGCYYDETSGSWTAELEIDERPVNLGHFPTQDFAWAHYQSARQLNKTGYLKGLSRLDIREAIIPGATQLIMETEEFTAGLQVFLEEQEI